MIQDSPRPSQEKKQLIVTSYVYYLFLIQYCSEVCTFVRELSLDYAQMKDARMLYLYK